MADIVSTEYITGEKKKKSRAKSLPGPQTLIEREDPTYKLPARIPIPKNVNSYPDHRKATIKEGVKPTDSLGMETADSYNRVRAYGTDESDRGVIFGRRRERERVVKGSQAAARKNLGQQYANTLARAYRQNETEQYLFPNVPEIDPGRQGFLTNYTTETKVESTGRVRKKYKATTNARGRPFAYVKKE